MGFFWSWKCKFGIGDGVGEVFVFGLYGVGIVIWFVFGVKYLLFINLFFIFD